MRPDSIADEAFDLWCELEWRRCFKSGVDGYVYFANTYVMVESPLFANGVDFLTLRPAQERFLRHCVSSRKVLTLKARQIGFTTALTAVLALAETFGGERPWECIILSKKEKDAEKALGKIKFAYDRLPKWMIARGPKLLVKSASKLEWDGSATIEALPSKSDPARSRTVNRIVIDEGAFFEDLDDAMGSIEPTLDTGGAAVMLSTANGAGDTFHDMWMRAETGDPGPGADWYPFFVPWWEGGEHRTDEWYAEKKRTMSPDKLAQEYPSNPIEAFIASGVNRFDNGKLGTWLDNSYPGTRGNLVVDGASWHIVKRQSGNHLEVWDHPLDGRRYSIGADPSAGMVGGDPGSVHVAKAAHVTPNGIEPPKVVAELHGPIPPTEMANELARIGRWYNQALLVVEVNGYGLSVIDHLRGVHRYRNMYRQVDLTASKAAKSTQRRIGFSTNRATRSALIEDLAAAIRMESFELPSRATTIELMNFVQRKTKTGEIRFEGRPHDDRVFSLALAWHGISTTVRETHGGMETHPDPVADIFAAQERAEAASRLASDPMYFGGR